MQLRTKTLYYLSSQGLQHSAPPPGQVPQLCGLREPRGEDPQWRQRVCQLSDTSVSGLSPKAHDRLGCSRTRAALPFRHMKVWVTLFRLNNVNHYFFSSHLNCFFWGESVCVWAGSSWGPVHPSPFVGLVPCSGSLDELPVHCGAQCEVLWVWCFAWGYLSSAPSLFCSFGLEPTTL